MEQNLVPQAIASAKEIDGAPKHQQEDRSSKAWEALRQAFMAIKKDATLLQGYNPADMQLLLELAVERGTKKKMLKKQVKETLDMLLGSPAWLATAQATPALLDRLEEFAQDFPALQERLAAPVEAMADAAQPMTTALAAEDASDSISEGWRKMTEFKFQFPKPSVTGSDIDDATEAFSIFFQGMQKIPAGARSDLLDKLSEQDYEHFMQFAEGLCEKKPSWRQRVSVVIRKWGSISPAFKEVADRRTLGATASAEAPPEAAAAPEPAPEAIAETTEWIYQPRNGLAIEIRSGPAIDGPRVGSVLAPEETFVVSEERGGDDGVTFLKLADGRGWVFDTKPGVGTICVRQEEEEEEVNASRQCLLPGWTRICHSDALARETSGAPLVWDLHMAEVRALAQAATRVRIQQRGQPSRALQSKPGTYPIEDVRRGVPIGYKRELGEAEVARFWEVPEGCDAEVSPAEKLRHSKKAWTLSGNDKLELRIYHCSDNAKGIHWSSTSCGWTHPSQGREEDLELYIDVQPPDDAEARKHCLRLTMAPTFCIHIKDKPTCSNCDGVSVHLWQALADLHKDSGNQEWRFENGRIKLVKAPGYCISAKYPDRYGEGGRGDIHLWQLREDSHNGSGNQKWIFEEGRVKLAKAPGFCLHIQENDPGNGVKVHLRPTLADSHKDSGSQKWHFSSPA